MYCDPDEGLGQIGLRGKAARKAARRAAGTSRKQLKAARKTARRAAGLTRKQLKAAGVPKSQIGAAQRRGAVQAAGIRRSLALRREVRPGVFERERPAPRLRPTVPPRAGEGPRGVTARRPLVQRVEGAEERLREATGPPDRRRGWSLVNGRWVFERPKVPVSDRPGDVARRQCPPGTMLQGPRGRKYCGGISRTTLPFRRPPAPPGRELTPDPTFEPSVRSTYGGALITGRRPPVDENGEPVEGGGMGALLPIALAAGLFMLGGGV